MSLQTTIDDSKPSMGEPSSPRDATANATTSPDGSGVRILRDLLTLTKPRIVFLILLTATVGYIMGAGRLDGMLLWHTLIGVGLLCGGSAALNQVIERERDALMVRTRKRPVAAHRISPTAASLFGAVLTIAGAAWLVATVNWLTAAIGVVTSLTYLAIYTPLKLKTTWSIFFGAVAGSLPPVMGWTAAQGSIGWGAIALFAIMLIWQVPHSFAIAILYRDDYSHADFAVAELAKRDEHVLARQIQLYTLLMIVLAAVPWALNLNGIIYLIGASLLGLGFLFVGVPLRRGEATAYARRVFRASLIYLPVLFIWMAVTRSTG